MVEGLVIMRGAEAQRPCYWTCPACSHSKLDSAKAFLDHVEQMHEEVQMLDASTPVSCHHCQHEVCSWTHHNPRHVSCCHQLSAATRCLCKHSCLAFGMVRAVPIILTSEIKGWSISCCQWVSESGRQHRHLRLSFPNGLLQKHMASPDCL